MSIQPPMWPTQGGVISLCCLAWVPSSRRGASAAAYYLASPYDAVYGAIGQQTQLESLRSFVMTQSSHAAYPEASSRAGGDRTLAINRARAIIRDFVVVNAGFDAGEPMTNQADDLAQRLADNGALIHTVSAPGADESQDAATVIRGFIAESAGSEATVEATDQAEQLRHRLAAAGLLAGGVYEPIALHGAP